MKKKIAWMVGGLIVLALLVWAFMPRATEVEVANVTQGRFERSVQEDGRPACETGTSCPRRWRVG